MHSRATFRSQNGTVEWALLASVPNGNDGRLTITDSEVGRRFPETSRLVIAIEGRTFGLMKHSAQAPRDSREP